MPFFYDLWGQSHLSTEGFIDKINTIPQGITSIALYGNDLGSKTGSELVEAFRALPRGITRINLSRNRLHLKTGSELAEAFLALPQGIASIYLSENELYSTTGSELVEALGALPQGISAIVLGDSFRNEHFLAIIPWLQESNLTYLELYEEDESEPVDDSIKIQIESIQNNNKLKSISLLSQLLELCSESTQRLSCKRIRGLSFTRVGDDEVLSGVTPVIKR